MIPVSLSLTNFLSHANTQLDLENIGMAIITGPNGHGKSTMLDAITYALFGAHNRQVRSIDKLIKTGASSMRVEFVFDLGGSRYRVARGRSTSPDKSILTFDVAHYNANNQMSEWKPLAGTITETQRLIEATLNMDHQTLINSCVLMQGNSDEFSRKQPSDRKDVLLRILGLDIYEAGAVKARKAHDIATNDMAAATEQLERLKAPLADEPELLSERLRLTTHIEACEADIKSLEDEIRGLAGRAETAVGELSRFDEIRNQSRDALARKTALDTEIKSLEYDIYVKRNAIADGPALEEQLRELDALKRKQEEFSKARELINSIRSDAIEVKAKRDELTQQRLERKRKAEDALNTRKANVQAHATNLQTEIANETRRLETEMARYLKEYQTHKDSIAASISLTRSRRDDLARSAALIDEVPCANSDLAGKCKLLTNAMLAKSQLVELDVKLTELADAEAALPDNPSLLKHAELEAQLANKPNWASSVELAAKQAELDGWRDWPEATALTKAQAEVDAPNPHQELFAELEAKHAQVVYNAAEHEETNRAIAVREHIPDKLAEIERIRAEISAAETIKESKTSELSTVLELLLSLDERLAGESEIKTKLANLRAEIAEREDQKLPGLRNARTASVDSLAVCNAKLSNIESAKAEIARLEGEWTEKTLELEDLAFVARMLGKNGVQAVLIETALPLIEDEANKLLSRIADGMTVTLETQKSGKNGIAETLEIFITDADGTKEYGLYSGGEKFRVDFALRIAMSKLLAHRAGARLETLIIDEGFGSQDADGMTRLMDCLETISDEFKCILVISHIEEMKEAFPVRIVVDKCADGSRATVIR